MFVFQVFFFIYSSFKLLRKRGFYDTNLNSIQKFQEMYNKHNQQTYFNYLLAKKKIIIFFIKTTNAI